MQALFLFFPTAEIDAMSKAEYMDVFVALRCYMTKHHSSLDFHSNPESPIFGQGPSSPHR